MLSVSYKLLLQTESYSFLEVTIPYVRKGSLGKIKNFSSVVVFFQEYDSYLDRGKLNVVT